ncbi:5-formyltetrahydrofolate cyclo-ligase [Vibrio sp. S11_S32]|uniref:5-formyltetrahydrofolate cyclo-ligase n=1 Tax=Vibrio sp. S11_S32 TaxID=2720225 RepID=UPI0016810845|nr:5-formyltetrahydrofolate cyclo-ligase [Vibrio sp. S11_S32]MBD1576261.1 5-formyltetrahydrofolate cyclo-ligase [Vibrio sp. S11_S32]
MNDALSRDQIRTSIRQKRQTLSAQEQTQAGLDLLSHIQQLPQIDQAQEIALYLSVDGEVDTMPTIQWLWQQNKKVLLPVIHPFSKGQLLFLNYTPTTPMIANQYGILEPKLDKTQICPLASVDIIFTPLVAFDDSGQRLGMGGGYYDRTLERGFETGTGASAIGLAHDCQKVAQLPIQLWDIPLATIVTPKQIWHWENNFNAL